MFNDLTGEELVDLISADLDNIKIRSVTFESRSHKTEYARIYFSYCDIIIRFPFIEIVDSGDVSLDRGSMTDDFQGDDELDVFVALKCVAIKAQVFIDDNPKVLSKFLNRYDVFKKCSKYGYWFKKSEHNKDYDKWHLYVCAELISKHHSLAALVTTVVDELYGN
ncbi:hypothetical protein [Methylobacter psychrophilus]|uniref:hypothetical protein n=1 Tax=Methylobacter psychrophilus TaxID=96941 RepID=UPI0021D50F08|nr:hypothetical protein [Methylobacter psychrophilus]